MFLSRHGSTKPFRTTVGCTGEIKSGIQFWWGAIQNSPGFLVEFLEDYTIGLGKNQNRLESYKDCKAVSVLFNSWWDQNVLFICCFEQFIPKYNSLKNNIYYFTVSVSRKVGSSIAGFWLRFSHEVTVRLLAAAGASEGKTGAGGYTSKMTYSHGCWQNTSPPGTLDVLK